MAGWHHRHDGHEFEQALGVGNGQGVLVCCGLWGRKESDMTERLHFHILKAISPKYSLEVLILKLKLQYFGHLMQRTDSFRKTLILGTAAMKLKDAYSLEDKT